MTRRRALLALAALVALAVAFLWGRTTAPAKVVERVRTVEVERKVEVKANETQAVRVAEGGRVVRLRAVRTRRADGSTVERNTLDYASGNRSSASEVHTAIEYRDREVIKTVERLKVIEAPRPSWHVAALVGLSASPALQAGASLSRRVAGPFSIGAWAVTNPREWKNASAGVSLGMEW